MRTGTIVKINLIKEREREREREREIVDHFNYMIELKRFFLIHYIFAGNLK
jgi:hypothetical protein